MMISRLTSCEIVEAPFMAEADNRRRRALVRARNAAVLSHLACIRPSAPLALMVSSAVRLSISVALRKAEARKVVSESSRILYWIT
jgi:hypothetical protein